MDSMFGVKEINTILECQKFCEQYDNSCSLQLRLDFNAFVISGPYTSTTTTDQYTKVLYGLPDNTGVEAMLTNSQCKYCSLVIAVCHNNIYDGLIYFFYKNIYMIPYHLGTTDSFSVTSPSGSSPPVICGTNTGEHSKSPHIVNNQSNFI